MKHFALIGQRLGHSHSKRLFDAQGFAGADYRLCEMASLEGLREWIESEGIDGFNVTNPYKRAVIPLLDGVSPEAAAVGAVNCVKVRRTTAGLHLLGHNTDAPAFRQTLADFLALHGQPHIGACCILGTGGAANAVGHALDQMGIAHLCTSRTPLQHPGTIGYGQIAAFLGSADGTALLINTTPVGTWPDTDASPLPSGTLCTLPHAMMVYDLIYNPSPTLLMRQATEQGAKVTDGMSMLRLQAELSWQIFFAE